MAKPNLNIRIGAVDRTGGAFRSINAGLGRVKNAVFSVQTAVAALAGATGFGLLVKGTIETNREFQSLEASLSTFLGSTEKAEKAFGILQQFAATTPFALREVVSGFNKLIARGLNPSISALTAFGNIASGTGKTLDQFVEAAADAAVGEFERLKEFGIKARSEGDKVVFTFKGVETEVTKSGAAISDFLVTLGETEFAGAIEKQSQTLNGAFSNLGDSFDMFKKSIGEAGFNEALVNLARTFSRVAQENDGLAQSIGRFLTGAVNAIPTAFGVVADAADLVRRNLDFLRKSFIAVTAFVFTRAILQQGVAFLRLAGALLTARKAATIYSATSKVLTLSTLATAIVFAQLTGTLDKLVEGIESAVKEATELLDRTFPGLKTELDKLFPSLNKDIDALEKLAEANDVTIDSTKKLDEALAELTGTMEGGTTKASSFKEAMEKLAKQMKDADTQMANVATRGLQSLEDNLVSVIMQTKNAKDAFKDMARSILADLVRMELRKQIIAPIAEALPGFLPGRAMGGPVTAGRPYMVGERGPELFVPGRTGGIVPNNQMGGSAVTVNQTINLTTGVSQTVRAEVLNMLPQIADAAKGAVMDAKRRGGSYAAALG
jgi:methyl-accepting chemotaxis protein